MRVRILLQLVFCIHNTICYHRKRLIFGHFCPTTPAIFPTKIFSFTPISGYMEAFKPRKIVVNHLCWLEFRRRWEDNIKMELQEMRGGCGDWMELAQNKDRWWALVSTVMNLRVP